MEGFTKNKKNDLLPLHGNSCRSQMAEGFGRRILGDRLNVYSAGIEVHGLNPKAVEVMAEKGVNISDQTSDIIDPEILNNANYVITLCGDAHDKHPITPPHEPTALGI